MLHGTEHLGFDSSVPDNVMSSVALQTAPNWLRMLFCIRSDGAQLQHVTQNAPRRYSPQFVSAHSLVSQNFVTTLSSVVRLFLVCGDGLRNQLLWNAMCKFSRNEYQFYGAGHEMLDVHPRRRRHSTT